MLCKSCTFDIVQGKVVQKYKKLYTKQKTLNIFLHFHQQLETVAMYVHDFDVVV